MHMKQKPTTTKMFTAWQSKNVFKNSCSEYTVQHSFCSRNKFKFT